MTKLALHAVLLALCVLAAGCASEASPAATPDPAVEPAAAEDAAPVAVDPGVGSHAHDYWTGRERVTLFDEDIAVEPLDVLVWGVMSTRVFGEPAFGGAFIDLPEGALVYEGTGRLELVATWSDTTVTGLRFVHRDAGSGEVKPWIETPNGETVAIEVTPQMTDMPHAQTSRWAFLFAASGAPAVAAGTFHVRIDIVKTRDVAEWPAHPDHWDGRDEILLADADGASAPRVGPEGLDDPWAEPGDAIASSEIVPMGAERLRVVVTLLSSQDAARVHLAVRTASDVSFDFDGAGEPTEVSDDGLTWTWELPVEMEQTDNPYADASAWAFRVVGGPAAVPDVPLCEHGCYASEVRYHLTATVHRGSAGGEETGAR